MNKSFFILTLCFFIMQVGFGQSHNPNYQVNLPKLTPVSPNAASLGKFGETPISYYTGIPNISIPLYSVKVGDIELPVTLDYHAGGVRVEEMASWVGTGWALNAGGIISRTVRGLPDEVPTFSGAQKAKQLYNNELSNAQRDTFLYEIYNQSLDPEADLYSFNVGGFSGKFFVTNENQIFAYPRSDIRVEYLESTTQWKITDGRGVQFFFQSYEQTMSEPYCGSGSSGYTNGSATTVVTSWYLNEIIDGKGNKVVFTYTNGGGGTFNTKIVETRNLRLNGNPNSNCPEELSYCYNINAIYGKTLSEINFAGGKIIFETSGTARLDNTTDYPLNRVIILNNNSDTLKSFKFHTGYFDTYTVGGCEDNNTYRLRLDSLTETGTGGTIISPYKFHYNSTPMACRLSNAQDYWGFYNGKSNTTFVRYKTSLLGQWLGADKSPDAAYAKAGILEKITYPTGGTSSFEYEGNTYGQFYPEGFAPDDSTIMIGHFRDNSNNSGNYLVTFSDTFTVGSGEVSPLGYKLLKIHLSKYCANPLVFNLMTVEIYRSGAYGDYHKVVYDNDTLNLIAGTYVIAGSIETEYAGTPYCSYNLDIYNIPYKYDRYVMKPWGGLRIKKMVDSAGFNALPVVQKFEYNSFDGFLPDSVSSGHAPELPDYSFLVDDAPNQGAACYQLRYNSMPNYPLSFTGGKPIGYRNVTITYGENGEFGKKQLTYTTIIDYPDSANLSFPYPSANERDWRRGLLLKEKDFAFKNSSYSTVTEKRIAYVFHTTDTTRKYVRSIKIGKLISHGANSGWAFDLTGLVYAGYLTVAEAFNMSSDTTVTYSQENGTDIVTSISNYEHTKNNFQLRQQSSLNSKGELITIKKHYPLDYASSSSGDDVTKGIHLLKQKNIISVPIEVYRIKTISSVDHIIDGQLFTYKPNSALPDSVYNLELSSPLGLTYFNSSTVNGSNNFIKDSNYKGKFAFHKYDTLGNIVQQSKANDLTSAYIWDYAGVHLTCEALGSDSTNIAYSSFESTGKGNWSYSGSPTSDGTSPTGGKCYSLSAGSISKTGLDNTKTYLVSYWSKNGSYTVTGSASTKTGKTVDGWTYYEHQASGNTSITISGSGYIDEVRLYPKGAVMNTYAHTPLKGVTAHCDFNNRITYYEYDTFGRLRLIRDQDKNVIKVIEYKYQTSSQQ